MKKTFWIALLIAVNILAIGVFIIWLLNRDYPIIGHDYRLFMPYMLDSYLHQKINGLTVQWYTPSFAGGRPVFANPQDLQFSLPQFLLWIVNPWVAIQASILTFISIGFIATYYFLKKIIGLGSFAGILGAVFFVANGFFFEHMAAGHVTFQPFPLFAVIVVILFHPNLPLWLARVLFSLVITIIIYTGIHTIPFFLLSSALLFPILYLIRPSLINWKRVSSITVWGGILSILVCGSRISAVVSFMHFFPRLAQDNYTTNLLTGTVGIIRQLLGTMNLTPVYRLLYFVNPNVFPSQSVVDMATSTGTPYGYWELDASLSPVLFLLLAGGAVRFLYTRPDFKARINGKKLIAISCLVLATWMTIEFILAKGIIYPLLRDLPILSSLRVNVRNISALIFPLSLVGAVIFDRWTTKWKSKKKQLAVFLLLDGIALAALLTYYWVPTKYAVVAVYSIDQTDYRPIQETYDAIRYKGETFPVKTVIPNAEPWTVFQLNASSTIDPYNTFFKQLTGDQITLHAGSVYDVTGGYFNIINPTGYLFPNANHSKMFERIAVSDEATFQDFINRRQPGWKLPLYQEVFGWSSLITLIAEILFLVLFILKKSIKLPDQIKSLKVFQPAGK